MKSTITQLYDYRQAQIPERYRRWRVQDEEIAGELETLAQDRAALTDEGSVEQFDAVQCRGVSSAARWNRPNVLFYPGRGLCAPELENACLGRRVGETYTVAVDGGEASFTVERIVRQRNLQVDDELVQAEGISGVATVADYYRWYREQHEPERRRNALMGVAYHLVQEIAEHSQFLMDPEEQDAWCRAEGQRILDIHLASGSETVRSEDERKQAVAKYAAQQAPGFQMFVTAAYLIRTMGGQDPDKVYHRWLTEIAAETELPPNAGTDDVNAYIEQESGKAFLMDMAYLEAATALLKPYAEECVEE